jgi:4-hydroxybenzoate polyprenyltransferase
MPTRSARLYSLALLLGDAFVLLLAFTLAYILRVIVDKRPLVENITSDAFIQTAFLLVPLWLMVFGFLGLYSSRVYVKRLTEWGRLLVGSFIGILIVLGYSFVIDEPVFPARQLPCTHLSVRLSYWFLAAKSCAPPAHLCSVLAKA